SFAGARRFDTRIQRQQPRLLGDSFNGCGNPTDLAQERAEGPETLLDVPDGPGEIGDVLHGPADQCAGLRYFGAGGGCGPLRLLGCTVNLTVSGHHGLGCALQLLELLRLVADAVGHLLEVACHVRKLDSQGADACGQFGYESSAVIRPAIVHGTDYAP